MFFWRSSCFRSFSTWWNSMSVSLSFGMGAAAAAARWRLGERGLVEV